MALASGNVAIFQIDATEGGTLSDISAFVNSVELKQDRSPKKAPIIGGGGIKKVVGPTDNSLTVKGWYDAATLGPIFSSYMSDTTPTTRSISYAIQGAAGQTVTGEVFVGQLTITTDADGIGQFSVDLEVDGNLTYA